MTSPRILVIDDEADLRELLELTLLKMGLDVDCAATLGAARAALAERDYALILTDMRLPDGQGIELVQEMLAARRSTPIAVITAFGSTDNAVAALKAGAFDYLSKPLRLDELRQMVQSALRVAKTDDGAPRVPEGGEAARLIGESAVMRDLRAQIQRLARSMAPVSISGESGSGKELAARAIHAHSARADKAFIAVNCGAIPEALMEAEFFGYRKGAFTGANDDRDGFFQAAHGGTLMLDEVADLPLAMQVKLLRAIQERRVRKVGATVEEAVDVRLVSATHQDLAECVEQGRFRQDLYYRLNVIELRLPPLRERLEDIGMLAAAILQRLAPQTGGGALSPAALDALQAYTFPGNVRELENILERALAFAGEGVIEVADLALKPGAVLQQRALSNPPPNPPSAPAGLPVDVACAAEPAQAEPASVPGADDAVPETLPASLPAYLDQVERAIILRALARTRFNRTQAAELLGISFRQLRYRMQRLSIREPEA
jgi:two-component system response regulator PilR (NtrC family)